MPYQESCEWCVYRDKENPDICKNCSLNETTKPKFELGKVDIFKLGEGLKKKQQEQNNKKPAPERNMSKQPIELGICPHCGKTSLFYNDGDKKYECLNLECKSNKSNIFDNVMWPDDSSKAKEGRDESAINHQEGLSNPSLLSVKMFLSDIRSWRRRYREGEYVCADFAQEVYDAATERGIRCGYVAIDFEKGDVGHAIVAFETDYGLKFFEPQSGNEEDVIVGRRYSTQTEGVPEQDNVRLIVISWNDGTSTRIS